VRIIGPAEAREANGTSAKGAPDARFSVEKHKRRIFAAAPSVVLDLIAMGVVGPEMLAVKRGTIIAPMLVDQLADFVWRTLRSPCHKGPGLRFGKDQTPLKSGVCPHGEGGPRNNTPQNSAARLWMTAKDA